MTLINESLRSLVIKDPWRNQFHIQPPTGLLNDPNGLIYHKGLYHVFYQWHPNQVSHGTKYWYHLTSSDLVNWSVDDRMIEPNSIYDNHGAYSGSAFVINDEIELFYTGNHRDENSVRIPYQVRTQLTATGIGERIPLISGAQEGYTDHFRDPKIFMRDNVYYMVIGAQRNNLTGAAVVYTSHDALKWEFAYELKTPFAQEAYMWECPDIANIAGQDVFIFCPQGEFDTPKHLTNIYPCTYAIGAFIPDTGEFKSDQPLTLLDHGFEFYASQTFLDQDQHTTLIAWVGLPEIDYPSDKNHWAHVLTIPRRLSIMDNKLYQVPHPNLVALRETQANDLTDHKTYELKIDRISKSFTIDIYKSAEESLSLIYDEIEETLTLDRSKLINQFGTERGTQRILNTRVDSLWILRDTSTVEIFINQGLYTMTSRFFPQDVTGDIQIHSHETLDFELYTLKENNHDL